MNIPCPRSDHFISAGPLSLHVETFGDKSWSPVLLVMGNSAPGLVWPETFCTALAAQGYYTSGIDGSFGPGTYNAINSYATAQGKGTQLTTPAGVHGVFDGLIY